MTTVGAGAYVLRCKTTVRVMVRGGACAMRDTKGGGNERASIAAASSGESLGAVQPRTVTTAPMIEIEQCIEVLVRERERRESNDEHASRGRALVVSVRARYYAVAPAAAILARSFAARSSIFASFSAGVSFGAAARAALRSSAVILARA